MLPASGWMPMVMKKYVDNWDVPIFTQFKKRSKEKRAKRGTSPKYETVTLAEVAVISLCKG